jgi:hypothetical protein
MGTHRLPDPHPVLVMSCYGDNQDGFRRSSGADR